MVPHHHRHQKLHLEQFINGSAVHPIKLNIPIVDMASSEMTPLTFPVYQYEITSGYYLQRASWTKVDIGTGVSESITAQMRSEMQKMINAQLSYSEIRSRMCGEEFLNDASISTPAPSPSFHPTASAPSTGTEQPFAPLIAGGIVALLFTGIFFILHRKRRAVKK